MISREFFFSDLQGSGIESQKNQIRGIRLLTKKQFVEKASKLKFKLWSPVEIRNRFLKMLEAKVSIMRNSINFTMNSRDTNLSLAQQEMQGNFDLDEEDEMDEVFSKILKPQKKKKSMKN